MTPARTSESTEAPALFLSLHGAGVQGKRQAECYEPKDWGVVVAPTNRRPFGFDWEDWGRLDALEVLHEAEERFGTDPRRTYLTGHSMGGHGTWNLGVHRPDRFAAIAPSAGWRDFWAYGGAGEWEDPSAVEQMLARAANSSRTLLMERNLLHGGVYVLHGDADRTVSVDQARFMRGRLAEFHPNWAYYERPGAGHWWGNQCMDWPPLFEFLRQNVTPEPHEVRSLEFATVHPARSSRCYWVEVLAQEQWLELSRVTAEVDVARGAVEVETENVERLSLDLAVFAESWSEELGDAALALTVDEDELTGPPVGHAGPPVLLQLDPERGWELVDEIPLAEKGPHRAGPFKDAFDRRVVLVYGTAGDDEHDAWNYARARYDAETFQYRGNGRLELVSDAEFDPTAEPDRNVVLYGNRETNGAWDDVLEASPIVVGSGGLTVGERAFVGEDLACLFVRPRRGSDLATVAVVSGTGLYGVRATSQLPYFVSGVGYPDWIVLSAEHLMLGTQRVMAAGFFGTDWSLESGQTAW